MLPGIFIPIKTAQDMKQKLFLLNEASRNPPKHHFSPPVFYPETSDRRAGGVGQPRSSAKADKEIRWIVKDKYAGVGKPEIAEDIKRLKKGEPVDYIIGWKPFLNCKIDLSFKPLIPRAETEYWTEKAIIGIKKQTRLKNNTCYAADVFAGSGCIGIAVLKNVKNSKVDFIEINPKFIKQIKLNLKLNKISSKRYRLIRSDIFRKTKKKYDFILSNPPYVSLTRKRRVQKKVLKYEPYKALFGGRNGLNYIRKFLKSAKERLNPSGQIWMEFDSSQKNAVKKLLIGFHYKNWQFYEDQYKKWRFVVIFT